MTCMELSRNAYKIFVGTPEGNIPLGRPRRRWENNIKVDLREVGCNARNCMYLAKIGTNGGLT